MKRFITPLLLSLSLLAGPVLANCVNNPPDHSGTPPVNTGLLVWHSYTAYGDGSSQLFVRDLAAGSTTNISSSWAAASGKTVRDPMNAVWSADGNWLLFMGENGNQSAWNLWAVKKDGTSLTNLTGSTGTTRNEDPKFTSDGTAVVWKQKQSTTYRIVSAPWSVSGAGVPSLGSTTTMKTGTTQNSMPFVDSAESKLYFSPGSSSPYTVVSQALSSGVTTGSTTTLSTSGYYPIVRWSDNTVFWADDTASGNDQISYKTGGSGTTVVPSLNNCNGNNSDMWPTVVSGLNNGVFFSATNGSGYQLYWGDLSTGDRYNLSGYYSDTAKAHLGASYYAGTSSGGGGGGGSGSSTTINLSQGHTATASSYSTISGHQLLPGLAVDGNTADTNSTRWDSTEPMPNPSWIVVDLGSGGTNQCAVGVSGLCTVSGITMYTDSFPTHYEIDSSPDGTTWTTVYTSTTGASYQDPTPINLNQTTLGGQFQTRYIRVYGTTGAPYGMSLPELQVFGCTAATCM